MDPLRRGTLRNGAIGGVAGAALGFVPIVLFFAPLLGGGIAGYLECEGPKRDALAGVVAGVLMAALSTVITGVVLFVRFGDLPFVSLELPLEGLALAAVLSLLGSIGQVIVAGLGGVLGGLLAVGHATDAPTIERPSRRRRWAAIAGSLLAGVVTSLAVVVALVAALDPLIWPSALVGLPVGFIVGAAVAVLGYKYFTRGPDSTIDWRAIGVGGVAVLVVFTLVVGGLFLVGQGRIDRNAQHTYEYQVTVSADRTLENATFYVPVPESGGESELGERFVQDVQYSRSVPAIEGYDPDPAPVDFAYELVETEHGRMLAISAGRIEVSRVYYRMVENETIGWAERIPREEYDPADPDTGVQHDGSFSFSVTLVTNESIETADPFGTEPLLDPRYNLTEVGCTFGTGERHECYEYDSRVFASYEAEANTTVYVYAELTGRNEWFSGGWTGNEYRQRVGTELLGPGTGWYLVEGELEIGSGRYRD